LCEHAAAVARGERRPEPRPGAGGGRERDPEPGRADQQAGPGGRAERLPAAGAADLPERPAPLDPARHGPPPGGGAGMQLIEHRVNTVEKLRGVPPGHGVELDLRDRGERLILQHDPFLDGEDFADYLRHYRHGLMILNVKSERIEPRVLELVRAAGVRDYF